MIKKLQHHLEEILVKQDQLSFTVNDKMKKSLQKNVTEIVKVYVNMILFSCAIIYFIIVFVPL